MIPVCKLSDLSIYAPQLNTEDNLNCSTVMSVILNKYNIEDYFYASSVNMERLKELQTKTDLGTGYDAMCKLWQKNVKDKKVLVYGDYDVDGVCATVIAMELAFRSGCSSVKYYIPHRQKEGYGLNENAMNRIIKGGFDTIIIVDCGSKDVVPVSMAKEAGIEVLIFDHHSVEGESVDISGFLNPQEGGDQEARSLCAAGVIWSWAFKSGFFSEQMLTEQLQLAAMATVSDCMPMGELNRAMVKMGLASLKYKPRLGLKELFRAMDLQMDRFDEEDLAMKIIPCLNAAGRLHVADLSVDLLAGFGNIRENVERLILLNRKRRELSTSICNVINKKISESFSPVIYDSSWPVGLLSAIASRLCAQHNRPFALAAPSGEGIRGTLRVPEGGNAVEILSGLDKHLEAWGGHRYAAGFTVKPQLWRNFSDLLSQMLHSMEVTEPQIDVIELDPSYIDMRSWDEISALGPFGVGNPAPVFYVKSDTVLNSEPLGSKGLHLKVNLGRNQLIAFNGAKQIQDLDQITGWVYRPRFNDFRGKKSLQFIVEKIVVE